MSSPSEFNLLYVFGLIRKYFWYLLAVIMLAGLAAIIFTTPYFYPPEFKSEAVVYPTNPERLDLDNLFTDEPMLYLYGDSKGVERLDNIATSESIQLYVMDSLNLWEVYGIDKEKDASPKYYGLETFNGNVKTLRIAGNGLKIEAYDWEPERAAAIVNLIVDKLNDTYSEMMNQNKDLILNLYKERANNLTIQADAIADSMRNIRVQYHIYDTERQSEALLKQVIEIESELAGLKAEQRKAKGASSPITNKVEVLTNQLYSLTSQRAGLPINLESFRNGYDKLTQLEWMQEEYAKELKMVQKKLSNFEVMSKVDLEYILFTEYASPSDRKSRPVRWVILAASLIISSLVAVIVLILIDQLLPNLNVE